MSKNPNRPNWIPAATAGVVLGAGLIAGYAMWPDGKSSPANNAEPTRDGTVPATASPFPENTPGTIVPSIIDTAPSASAPATSTESATPSATPEDEQHDRRLAIARRYGACSLGSFTNGGVVKVDGTKRVLLNLDLNSFDRDESGADDRKGATYNKEHDLYVKGDTSWTAPQIVMYAADANGESTGVRYDNAVEPGGDVDPLHTKAYAPAKVDKGTVLAVAVETTAYTKNPEGGYDSTTVDVLCGGIVNQGATDWRPYSFDAEVPPVITQDHLDHLGGA